MGDKFVDKHTIRDYNTNIEMRLKGTRRKNIKRYYEGNVDLIPLSMRSMFPAAIGGDIGSSVIVARNLVSGVNMPPDRDLGWGIFNDLREDLSLFEGSNYIEYNYSLALIETGERHNGIGIMKSLADNNYSPAVTRMGNFYDYGNFGVSPDLDKAIDFYKKAARLGHFPAKSLLWKRLKQKPDIGSKITGIVLSIISFLQIPFYAYVCSKGFDERIYL